MAIILAMYVFIFTTEQNGAMTNFNPVSYSNIHIHQEFSKLTTLITTYSLAVNFLTL